MRSFFIYALLLYIVIFSPGCKKNNGNGPPAPPPGSTSWLVKDISTKAQCSSGGDNFEHLIFTYDNDGKIIRFIDSVCAASTSYGTNIIYNDQGKITELKGFQGIYPLGSTRIVYNSTGEFIAQAIPEEDTVHNATIFLGWNAHSNKELDGFRYQGQWISGSPNGPHVSYTDFYYDDGGGLHSESSHYEGANPQADWTLFSAGTGPTIPNPFHVGRTPEQNFLYSLLIPKIGYLNLLASGLANGIFESYVYVAGVRETRSHFYYNYVLDSNNNVSKIIAFSAADASNFSTFGAGTEWDITYEQH